MMFMQIMNGAVLVVVLILVAINSVYDLGAMYLVWHARLLRTVKILNVLLVFQEKRLRARYDECGRVCTNSHSSPVQNPIQSW